MRIIWLLLWLLASVPVLAEDLRFCGPPPRDADGVIVRSSAVLREFRRIHPCPSTGLTSGACPGWQVDHIVPLSACGCDSVLNLQYLPSVLKSGPGTLPKDRWERRIYKCLGTAIQITPMPDPQKFRLEAVPR